MNVVTHCKFLCGIAIISFLFSGCAILESFTACKLPKDVTTRFETYKKEAKNDEEYKNITALEYEWKKVFGLNDFSNSYTAQQRKEYKEGALHSEEARREHCAFATQAYKEITDENPNILKVNGAGLEKKLKMEKDILEKVENRKIRKLDEKANKKLLPF